MMIFYDFLFVLFTLFYLPYFIFTRRYRYGLKERFGIVSERLKFLAKNKKLIWIHAVSVGEMRTAGILAPLLRREFPNHTLAFSSITHTGNRISKTIATSEELTFYLPLDLSLITDRFVKLLSPDLFISLESELWPNLTLSLKKNSIPIILVNGRISKRSFQRYKLVKILLKSLLNRFVLFCMQSEKDLKRIIELGAEAKKVECTGNLKFDISMLKTDPTYRERFRTLFGIKEEDLLFVCGSTHRGEEAILLRLFRNLHRDWQNLKILIAPRHIERAEEVSGLTRRFGFEPVNISHHSPLTTHHSPSVFILDIMGELQHIYSAADMVFVGGSLVKRGGHNPIEPAIFSKPIILGKWIFNFQDIADTFIENNGAILVENEQELFLKIEFLLRHPEARKTLGFNAREVVRNNTGSAERTVAYIRKILSFQ